MFVACMEINNWQHCHVLLQDENMKLLDDLQGANKDRWYLKEALATAVTKKEELVTQVQLLEVKKDK